MMYAARERLRRKLMMDDFEKTDTSLKIGKRIAEVAAELNINQKSMAEKLEVSQGFLSSVINNQKIPGSEFLYKLNKLFGVSADWILTGDGGMYGQKKINIQLLKEIQILIGIGRSAIVEKNATAQKILSLLKEKRLFEINDDKKIHQFLINVSNQNEYIYLVIGIYNNNVWISDSDLQRNSILSSIIDHFEFRNEIDIYSMKFDPDLIPVYQWE